MTGEDRTVPLPALSACGFSRVTAKAEEEMLKTRNHRLDVLHRTFVVKQALQLQQQRMTRLCVPCALW